MGLTTVPMQFVLFFLVNSLMPLQGESIPGMFRMYNNTPDDIGKQATRADILPAILVQ